MLGSQTNDLFGVGGTDLLMVEVTPGFKAGVTATVVGLGVGGGVVAGSEKKHQTNMKSIFHTSLQQTKLKFY